VADFDVLPALSSSLNVATTTLLFVGWRRIKRKDVDGHRRTMLTALVTSAAFLLVYLVNHSIHGVHGCGATGGARTFYLFVLWTHTPLAAAVAYLAPRTAWLGVKGRFEAHRRLARITLPIWIYVSVTGVAVYVMAYHLWPPVRAS
jgi:putative membrane protein